MNSDEFLKYVNESLPPPLEERITRGHLKQWADVGILRPPYYKYNLHEVMALMKWAQMPRPRERQQGDEARRLKLKPPSSIGVSQILSILNEDARERAVIRLALLRSGLITAPGFVAINFSRFTGTTFDSLPPSSKSRFQEASERKELLIIQECIQFEVGDGGEEQSLAFLNPVLFVAGVKPSLVYSTFIFGSKGRLVGPDDYEPLARPLYEEFLDLDVRTSNDILGFMATHLMIGSFGVPHESSNEVEFLKAAQDRMRQLLCKATKGTISVADLSPLLPYHEDDVAEGARFGRMGAMEVFTPDLKPKDAWIRFRPAWKQSPHGMVPYDKSKLAVRRYYSWLDFMWAELVDSIAAGCQPPVCLRCGKLLSHKRGRKPQYCGPDNPKCYRARKAESVRWHRAKREDVTGM